MARYEPTRERPDRQPRPREDARERLPRDAYPRLSSDDLKSLRTVGSFRMIDRKDAPEINVDRLVQKGVLRRKTLYPAKGGSPREVLSLTKKGKAALHFHQHESNPQRYWEGMVKPREVEHDLGIYKAYQAAEKEIEAKGGKVKRIVLDYELKSDINRRMNRPNGPSKSERRKELAEEYELPIVKDKLMLPDLRIEYTDSAGREQHLDVEVMTKHYRGSHASGKAEAGFARCKIYDDHRLGFL